MAVGVATVLRRHPSPSLPPIAQSSGHYVRNRTVGHFKVWGVERHTRTLLRWLRTPCTLVSAWFQSMLGSASSFFRRECDNQLPVRIRDSEGPQHNVHRALFRQRGQRLLAVRRNFSCSWQPGGVVSAVKACSSVVCCSLDACRKTSFTSGASWARSTKFANRSLYWSADGLFFAFFSFHTVELLN